MGDRNPYLSKEEKLAEEQERETVKAAKTAKWHLDLRHVMSQQQGRDVMYRLLDDSGVLPGSRTSVWDPNALTMSKKAGHQEMGQTLQDALFSACRPDYFTMLDEHGGN